MQIKNLLQVIPDEVEPLIKTKYAFYASNSSEAEEKQALSIDSQVKEQLMKNEN